MKVAEYQARGVVHFHAVIRLDAPGDTYQPPPGRYTTGLLADAITQAAAAAYVATDRGGDCGTVLLRFGTQADTRPIRHGPDGPLTAQAVANYIGKYATKSLDAPGLPAPPIRHIADAQRLTCSRHYQQMITTAWRLGGTLPADDGQRLRRWAHMLGYGGHYLTKSRRYSVSFGQLRAARTQHRRTQIAPNGETDPWGRELDETVVLVLTDWHYAGTGHTTIGDHQLALAAAARAREHTDLWPAGAA